MYENQLTRRKFLLITVAGTFIILLDSCGGESTKPISKSTPSPQSSSRLLQILPESITTRGLGVNIHFVEPRQGELETIVTGGFGVVRIDFPWSDIERNKRDGYNFLIQEKLIKALETHGIRALAILAYGNSLYDNSTAPFHAGPHTDEVRQAFARFASEAAAKFKGHGVIWEIWNEPNNPDFWQPKPNADEYMKLAKVTIEAMRQVDKDAIIIAPAITTYPQKLDFWNFIERCFVLGLLEQVDAVSIHPYRYDKQPETVIDDYQRLHALIANYKPESKKSIPIISSEWGYPITTSVSKDFQAALLLRQFIINNINGIPLSVWYDWHDDGQDPQNIQNTFGVLTWDYQPKPAYFVVQTLMKELIGYRFNKRLSLPSKGDYAVLFTNGNSKKLVAWTVDNPHPVRLPVDVSSVMVVSMIGETRTLTPTNGALVIDLTGNPQYLLTGI
jgi:polysaccharide biosynthesis protein PslG